MSDDVSLGRQSISLGEVGVQSLVRSLQIYFVYLKVYLKGLLCLSVEQVKLEVMSVGIDYLNL